MQDPTTAFGAPFPEQHLKCPRCGSTSTKFCYYNNYNLAQPRHFCKNCRRYWTKGGALRNIPVGGGSRKNSKRSSPNNTKRSSSSSSTTDIATSTPTTTLLHLPKVDPFSVIYPRTADPDHQMLDITGSFSSLLESNGNFGYFSDSFHSVGSGVLGLPNSADLNLKMDGSSALTISSSGKCDQSGNPPPPPENLVSLQGESICCIGANGWPDLAMYTSCSSFQ